MSNVNPITVVFDDSNKQPGNMFLFIPVQTFKSNIKRKQEGG